jgi:hypothetical protein
MLYQNRQVVFICRAIKPASKRQGRKKALDHASLIATIAALLTAIAALFREIRAWRRL